MKPQVLAIIPARGGSKGLPGKNLLEISGKPLIVWSIEQALKCAKITDTVVSTDSEQIAEVARAAGALVPFIRPDSLAADDTPTEPVMRHALDHMEGIGRNYDAVMLLQPTSPLRLHGTLDKAAAQFEKEICESLCGVVESHAFFWSKNPVEANYDPANRPRRQDLSEQARRYRETGSVYITSRDAFATYENRLAGTVTLFEMEQCEGLEIDSRTDFLMVEALMKEFTA